MVHHEDLLRAQEARRQGALISPTGPAPKIATEEPAPICALTAAW
jgi:hypothetical protein